MFDELAKEAAEELWRIWKDDASKEGFLIEEAKLIACLNGSCVIGQT